MSQPIEYDHYCEEHCSRKHVTPLRNFYAWVGFVTICMLVIGIIAFIVWGNHYIDINLHG